MLSRLDLLTALRKTFQYETFTARQLSVMLVLAGPEGTYDFRAVVRDLRLTKPVISRACKVLHERGLVEKRTPDHDTRLCELALTTAGMNFVGSMVSG